VDQADTETLAYGRGPFIIKAKAVVFSEEEVLELSSSHRREDWKTLDAIKEFSRFYIS